MMSYFSKSLCNFRLFILNSIRGASALIVILLFQAMVFGAGGDDFQLNLNSRWQLYNPALTTPVVLSIVEDMTVAGVHRGTPDLNVISWQFQVLFVVESDVIYGDGLQFSGDTMNLPVPAPFSPLNLAAGQKLNTSYGSV